MLTTEPAGVIVDGLEKGCASWRCGDDMDGLARFQKACLVWLSQLDSSAWENLTEHWDAVPLMNSLTMMLDRIHDSDIIHATDIIEYEIIPVLKQNFHVERGVQNAESDT